MASAVLPASGGAKRCGKGTQVPPFQRSQCATSMAIVVRRRERAREAQASDCDEAGRERDAYRSAKEPWSGARIGVLRVGGAVKLHNKSPCLIDSSVAYFTV